MASNQPPNPGDASKGQSNNQSQNALFTNTNQQGGLFGGQGQSSLFANPSNPTQPSLFSSTTQQKPPTFGLASSNTPALTSLFGGSTAPSQQGMFGGNPFQGGNKEKSKSDQTPKSTTSLFGPQTTNPENKELGLFGKSKVNDQAFKTPPSNFSLFGNTAFVKPQPIKTPEIPANDMKKQEKVPQAQLFGGMTAPQGSMFGGDQKGGMFSGGSNTGGLFGKNEKKDEDSSPSSGFSLFGGAGQKSPNLPDNKAGTSAKASEGLFGNQGNSQGTVNPMFKNIQDSKKSENKPNPQQQAKKPSPIADAPQKTGVFDGSSNSSPLFGGSKPQSQPALFGGPAKIATGLGSLFGGDKLNSSISPFSKQKAKVDNASINEGTNAPPPLFGSSKPTNSLFGGNDQVKTPASVSPSPALSQKSQSPLGGLFGGDKASNSPSGSLFGGDKPSGSLFGGQKLKAPINNSQPSNQPSISSPSPSSSIQTPIGQKEGLSVPSLFGPQTTPQPTGFFGSKDTSFNPKSAQTPANDKSGSLFGNPNIKRTDSSTKINEGKMDSDQKQAPVLIQQKQTTVRVQANSVKEQSKPTSTIPTNATPSLFSTNNSAGLFNSNKPIPQKNPQQSLNKPKQPEGKAGQRLYSFSQSNKKTQQTSDKNHTIGTTRPSEPGSEKINFGSSERRQTESNAGTINSSTTPSRGFAFLKPREVVNDDIIDFKTLKEEQNSQTFNNFLSQSLNKIVTSVKMYFSCRFEKLPTREAPSTLPPKQVFIFDLTTLMIKVLGLNESSSKMMDKFIRRTLIQQRYERCLFKEQQLIGQYFGKHMIYKIDRSNKYILNENGSRQLLLLIEKISNKWNVEKLSLVNLLLQYSELFHKPSDLFQYFFRQIFEMERKVFEISNQNCQLFIQDLQALIKCKIVALLNEYNKKLKNFNVINKAQLKNLIKLFEQSKDETVVQVSLKIFLTNLNFKQPKQIPVDLLQAIRDTKSFATIPLKALAYRLQSSKRLQFIPTPKNLYKYIRGDEWIDWFDIYLTQTGKEGVQLQIDEPQLIVQALCTLSGPLLLQRLLSGKRGVLKFFNLLRDENMISLYYKILQTCLFDEKSINQVEQFYFKKMHFNLEYQQIIQYVINFHEGHGGPNEQIVLSLLEAKINLLLKILEIAPGKLVEVERYLFMQEYNKNKKFKGNEGKGEGRQGEKIVHIFLDTIDIISRKGLSSNILCRIFSVLSCLLKSKQTQKTVLRALSTNKPSFIFMQGTLHPSTISSMNQLFTLIVSKNYLYDLIIGYDTARQQSLKYEALYPFRYRDFEYSSLIGFQSTDVLQDDIHFSIYWFNQLAKIINRQKFNPELVLSILTALNLKPFSMVLQSSNIAQDSAPLYHRAKTLDSRIPIILQTLITYLNDLAIWQDISHLLQFKIIRNGGKLGLSNKFIMTSEEPNKDLTILTTLKLMREIFQISDLLIEYEDTCQNHFIVKTLGSINCLSKSKIASLFASHSSKNGLIMSIIAPMMELRNIPLGRDDKIVWEIEHDAEEQVPISRLLEFLNKNKGFDVAVANNWLIRPKNASFEIENTILSVILDLLVSVIKLSPQCSIQQTLTIFLPLKDDQKNELKTQILNNLTKAVTKSTGEVLCKALDFIYKIKYDCGANKLHYSLANKLFAQFVRTYKNGENSGKFNASLCRYLFKELENGQFIHQSFTEQYLQYLFTTFRLKDNYLKNYYEFRDTKQIGRMIKHYQNKQYSLLNLNQVQRMLQQKAISQIGFQLQTLGLSSKLLTFQLIRRKHSQGLVNCLITFNSLLLNNNLLLLQLDLPKPRSTSTFQPLPRLYLRDPIEHYISESKDKKLKSMIQVHQKNNVVQWLLHKCKGLSDALVSYVKFQLTIDKYLYANNPMKFSVDRSDIAHFELFSHLALGKMNIDSSQIFGKSLSDSIDIVSGIGVNIINRLVQIKKQREVSGQTNIYQESFKEGTIILGFCFEWLRGKDKFGENATTQLLKKIQKYYHCLLPENGMLISEQSLKVLISVLSLGQGYFSPEAKADIHRIITTVVERYSQQLLKSHANPHSSQLGELFQQSIAILLIIPPQKSESNLFELITRIWVKQHNFQYFYNQSRIMLELCTLYPDEMVKLQPLTRCEIIAPLSSFYNRYEGKDRRFQGMAWTWVVKIASALASHEQSILVVSEVGHFFNIHKESFINLFEFGDKISKGYLDDLDSGLQLLFSLFSHQLWINFNRPLAQELTFLLSHKVIRLFVAFSQGKLSFLLGSDNDRTLAKVKIAGLIQQQIGDNLDSLTQESMYALEMKIKMNYCLTSYCLLMKKAFKSSHYVQKYFDNSLTIGQKYYSSFWDFFNKNLTALFSYSLKQFKTWNDIGKVTQTLTLLYQCYHSPHSFIENGYLSTVIPLPKTEYQLFSEIYLMNYLILQLATVHLFKEKLYINKSNPLLKSHYDAFAKKIKEYIDNVNIETRKVNIGMNQFITEQQFKGIKQLIDNSKPVKI